MVHIVFCIATETDIPTEGDEMDRIRKLFESNILKGTPPTAKTIDARKVFDPLLKHVDSKVILSWLKTEIRYLCHCVHDVAGKWTFVFWMYVSLYTCSLGLWYAFCIVLTEMQKSSHVKNARNETLTRKSILRIIILTNKCHCVQ